MRIYFVVGAALGKTAIFALLGSFGGQGFGFGQGVAVDAGGDPVRSDQTEQPRSWGIKLFDCEVPRWDSERYWVNLASITALS